MKRNVKIISERTIMIILVTTVCAFIPRFLPFLNIMGSLGSGLLAFILPPFFYLKVLGEVEKIGTGVRIFNYALVVLGVLGSGFSMYVGFVNLLK